MPKRHGGAIRKCDEAFVKVSPPDAMTSRHLLARYFSDEEPEQRKCGALDRTEA
jgi:hypothetical protein